MQEHEQGVGPWPVQIEAGPRGPASVLCDASSLQATMRQFLYQPLNQTKMLRKEEIPWPGHYHYPHIFQHHPQHIVAFIRLLYINISLSMLMTELLTTT